ncbi:MULTISPECIES: dTDP-4-dehydrorhamnose reductase [Bacillus]|uniref:dTDP-4-dehydrorhamnose reductase n=1 Tax=Bacillus TaxID=1386 RepID=UPI001CD41AAE|nr:MULTISPECIES: dTDP-4-dehydrorhamnose reductase [Bacillus]MCA1036806.1 dTDP-4-dehydrorhamnose reductase [Bacillus infantis]
MKVAITGAGGQLGRELTSSLARLGCSVLPFSRDEWDITDAYSTAERMKEVAPEVLINAAAFTAVDLCETQREEAFLINAIAPFYLAREAKRLQARFIHISTDYVFSGDQSVPWEEQDPPFPLNAYGESKRAGETLAMAANPDTLIIRTSWLYGHGGKNFVNTIARLLQTESKLEVVRDQMGSPTYTKDLAEAVYFLLEQAPGIYHVSNGGSCSWFEFAKEIAAFLKSGAEIEPVSTEAYGLPARRPPYSVLGNKKLNSCGFFMRNWKDALYDYLAKEAESDAN